jgi:hypothetical protein
MLRHRPHESNVAVVSLLLLRNKTNESNDSIEIMNYSIIHTAALNTEPIQKPIASDTRATMIELILNQRNLDRLSG